MQSHDSAVIANLKEIVTAYQAHLKEGEKKIKKQTRGYFTAQQYFDDEFKLFSDTSNIISFFDQHSAATYLELKNIIVTELLKTLDGDATEFEKVQKFTELLDKWAPALESRRGKTGTYMDSLFINEKQIVDYLVPHMLPDALAVTGIEMVKKVRSLLESSFVQTKNIFTANHCVSVSERKSTGHCMLGFKTRDDAIEFCKSYRHLVNPIFTKDDNDCSILVIDSDEYHLLDKHLAATDDKKFLTKSDDSQKDLELISNVIGKLESLKEKINEEHNYLEDSVDIARKNLSISIVNEGLRMLKGEGCASVKLKQFSGFFNKKQSYLERLQYDSVTFIVKSIAELILPRSVTSTLFKQKKAVTEINKINSDLKVSSTPKKT